MSVDVEAQPHAEEIRKATGGYADSIVKAYKRRTEKRMQRSLSWLGYCLYAFALVYLSFAAFVAFDLVSNGEAKLLPFTIWPLFFTAVLGAAGFGVHLLRHSAGRWRTVRYEPDGTRPGARRHVSDLLADTTVPMEVRARVAAAADRFPTCSIVVQHYDNDPIVNVECPGGALVAIDGYLDDRVLDLEYESLPYLRRRRYNSRR
jgi:hypothetical protein